MTAGYRESKGSLSKAWGSGTLPSGMSWTGLKTVQAVPWVGMVCVKTEPPCFLLHPSCPRGAWLILATGVCPLPGAGASEDRHPHLTLRKLRPGHTDPSTPDSRVAGRCLWTLTTPRGLPWLERTCSCRSPGIARVRHHLPLLEFSSALVPASLHGVSVVVWLLLVMSNSVWPHGL